MSLREVCRAFNRQAPRRSAAPSMSAIETVAQSLAISTIARVELIPIDLDAVSRRLHSSLENKQPLSKSDLRIAPWCLWATESPLSNNPMHVESLLSQLLENGRRRAFRVLAAAWLKFYLPGGPVMSRIGEFIATHIDKLGPPWLEAHQSVSLFSADHGPSRLAQRAFEKGATPDDVLVELGFGDPSSFNGYRKDCFRLGYALIEGTGAADPFKRLELLKRWTLDQGRARIDSLRVTAVKVALRPFESAMPDKAIRDAYLGFILPLIGDPRVNAARWNDCKKEETIVRRWLTEQTLRQFFEVVDKVAQQEHWTYRRAFWNALYVKGLIDEAWVVFENSGADQARYLFGRDISFGRFSGGSIQAGQSVLLLRVGSLVVAEWSHSSPCSIWDDNMNERGPAFYLKEYSSSALKKDYVGDISGDNLARQGVFWHRGSETYSWQTRVASFLSARRGIRVTASEYRV